MPSIFNCPEVKALAKKVKVELYPKTSEILANAVKKRIRDPSLIQQAITYNNIVELTARGEKFIAEEIAMKGSPTNPASEDELLVKFRNNASFSMLPSDRVEPIIKMINQLEEVDDITELTRLLTIS